MGYGYGLIQLIYMNLPGLSYVYHKFIYVYHMVIIWLSYVYI